MEGQTVSVAVYREMRHDGRFILGECVVQLGIATKQVIKFYSTSFRAASMMVNNETKEDKVSVGNKFA